MMVRHNVYGFTAEEMPGYNDLLSGSLLLHTLAKHAGLRTILFLENCIRPTSRQHGFFLNVWLACREF